MEISKCYPYTKKEDISLSINYRLIGLTSVVGKLMEIIIRDKLVTFLENIMINNPQHGFRKIMHLLNEAP